MTPSIKTRRLALLAVIAASLTACHTSAPRPVASKSPSPTPSATPSVSTFTCDMVTPAEINAALGMSVGLPSVNKTNPPISVCTYAGTNPPGTVVIQFEDGQDATAFAAEKASFNNQNQPTTDLPGYGDEAFTSTISANNKTVQTLVVRKGDVEILISASAPLATVEALAQKILGQV